MFSVDEIHIDTLASRMASSHRQPITAESPLLMASAPPTDTLIHWLHWNKGWRSTNAPHAWCLLWILPFIRLHNTRDVKNLFFVPLLNWICTGMLKKELQCCIWNVRVPNIASTIQSFCDAYHLQVYGTVSFSNKQWMGNVIWRIINGKLPQVILGEPDVSLVQCKHLKQDVSVWTVKRFLTWF